MNCQISVCGEVAGDPLGAVVLLGLGYDNLSMSANGLLKVKSMLNQVSKTEARTLAKRALRMSDAGSVSVFLSDALNRPELSKLYRPVLVEKS